MSIWRLRYALTFFKPEKTFFIMSLQWRHNRGDSVSNHQPHDCLLNRLFRHRWKKTPKFRVTGLCEGNKPVTGEFPTQRASNAENISIWWRHHVYTASIHTLSQQLLHLPIYEQHISITYLPPRTAPRGDNYIWYKPKLNTPAISITSLITPRGSC